MPSPDVTINMLSLFKQQHEKGNIKKLFIRRCYKDGFVFISVVIHVNKLLKKIFSMSVLTMQQTPYEKIGLLTDGADLRNTSFLLCPFQSLGFILSSLSLVSCEHSGQWW